MSEESIENEIQEKGLTTPRITPDHIQYIGVKMINAKPMTRIEYNDFRGWKLDDREDGSEEGYLVEYLYGGTADTDSYPGYVSWSPKNVFDKAYCKCKAMTFGFAIEAMKKGLKVCRSGWNGKGMFIYYVPASKYPSSRNTLNTMKGIFPDDMVPYGAYIAMKTAQNNVVPWLASQPDMLADDWELVE